MSEISNNLLLYRYLRDLPPEDQQAEYALLAPTLKFKVKTLGYLLKKGKEYDALHTQAG